MNAWRWLSLVVLVVVSAHPWPVLADIEGCVNQAARRYQVNKRLIHAIIQVESSGNPSALNRNANGTEDIGIMQINTSWLPTLARYGIDRHHLYDPCTNIHIGAWVLARSIARYGHIWRAVGAYNATSHVKRERYVAKVWKRYLTGAGSES